MQQIGKHFDFTVFIGRFQPIHLGHMHTIRLALRLSDKLIMVIGSHKSAPSTRQPWDSNQRIEMIKKCLNSEEIKKVIFIPIRDRIYSEFAWNQNILNEVLKLFNPPYSNKSIALIGHNKDATSYYLKNFPNWEFIETGNFHNLNSTQFRQSYFSNSIPNYKFIPNPLKHWLKKYRKSSAFQNLKEEYLFVANKKKQLTQNSFTVANSLLLCGNYILLVRRKHFPGKYLFALPGGHLEKDETPEEAAFRELKEETNIELNLDDLKTFFVSQSYYDYPERNPISRYYAHVFFYRLSLTLCPKVEAGDDAQEVEWVLLDELAFMESQFFSDHYQIIQMLLGRINELNNPQ